MEAEHLDGEICWCEPSPIIVSQDDEGDITGLVWVHDEKGGK
jgi:hypothetical protein